MPSRSASGGGKTVEEDEPPQVVDKVGHADLCRRPGDADGADEEVHPVFLDREDVLDAGADFRFQRVGIAHRLRHRAARGLLAVDAADEAVLGQELLVDLRPIGRVGPHRAGGVGLVEQPLAEPRALVSRGVAGVPTTDQAVLAIDRDVVLIAECRNGDVDSRPRPVGALLGLAELDRPTGVSVLVAELGGLRLPILGNTPLFDRLLFVLGIALMSEASTIWPPIAM